MMVLIETFAAAAGTLGIGVLFNIKGKNLIYASIGGGLSWLFYRIFMMLGITSIPAMFFSSIVISTYSEICARIFKTPVTVFLICSLIPLVPGAQMYYTMVEAIQGTPETTWSMALTALSSAAILAFGVIVVSTIIKIIYFFKNSLATIHEKKSRT